MTARLTQAPPLPGTIEAFMQPGRGRLGRRGRAPPPRPAHHRGAAPRHRQATPPRCILVRCSSDADRRYLPCDATCEAWFERDGQVIGVRAGHPGHQPPASPRPWSIATPPARSPAAGPPAVCTHTTSGTGKTVVRPNSPTWCWCAPTTTGCIIAASSPSPDPPTSLSSPTAAERPLSAASLARPPTRPPPAVPPCPGPPGERADWWW